MSRAEKAKPSKLTYVMVDPMSRTCDVLLDGQVIGRVGRREPFPLGVWPRRRVRGWVIFDPDDVSDIVWPTRRHAANALRKLAETVAAADQAAAQEPEPG